MNNPNTNEELVLDLMNWSPFGVMGQVFIMTAIQEYAKQVAAQPAVDQPGMMFSAETWKAIAIDVDKRCKEFYGRHELKAQQVHSYSIELIRPGTYRSDTFTVCRKGNDRQEACAAAQSDYPGYTVFSCRQIG
jgi:hypothetical protein